MRRGVGLGKGCGFFSSLVSSLDSPRPPSFPVPRFWSYSFVHLSPEIERLLESVSRSCGPKSAEGAAAAHVVPQLQPAAA